MNMLEFESSDIQDEAGVSAAVKSVVNARPNQPLVLVAGMGKTEQRLLEAGEKAAAQDLVLASTIAEGARTFYMQVARQLTSEPKISSPHFSKSSQTFYRAFISSGSSAPREAG
jgi:hypothetical protein